MSKNLEEEYQNITEEKNIPNLNEITDTESFFLIQHHLKN